MKDTIKFLKAKRSESKKYIKRYQTGVMDYLDEITVSELKNEIRHYSHAITLIKTYKGYITNQKDKNDGRERK